MESQAEAQRVSGTGPSQVDLASVCCVSSAQFTKESILVTQAVLNAFALHPTPPSQQGGHLTKVCPDPSPDPKLFK